MDALAVVPEVVHGHEDPLVQGRLPLALFGLEDPGKEKSGKSESKAKQVRHQGNEEQNNVVKKKKTDIF